MATALRIALMLGVFACGAAAETAIRNADPQIMAAFEQLYSFQFERAHKSLDQLERSQPERPIVYALRSAVLMFSEMERLGVLASEFFQDRGEAIEKNKVDPDPEIEKKILALQEKSQTLAKRVLAEKPNDIESLYVMSMADGIASDYHFFIAKRWRASLRTAKSSHNWSRRLLEIDPTYYDAYLTTGLNEYLIGDLPFFLRWFIRFDGVEGNKQEGIRKLKQVAEQGLYTRTFAKILLATAYLREKQHQDCVEVMEDLVALYPDNPLFRRELVAIREKAEKAGR